MENFDLLRVLKFLPGIILGLTVHEFCHALVAHLCGDSTSKDQGRVTLNPLKHIDPVGFLLLIVAGFGWAKPVQFREENLRNPKSDVVKIALAGPLSNALIAMILSIVLAVILKSSPSFFYTKSGEFIYEIFRYAIFINWGLFIFNLIPLPPLDGSHVLLQQLKNHPELHDAIYKYGSWLLFGLIIISFSSKIDLLPIGPAMEYLSNGFLSLVGVNI
jgi:Zn-dependent protease